MATIVGIEADGGVALAGDRLAVDDGAVRSENQRRVFEFDAARAAATGASGDVDEFRRRLDAEVRAHETETGEPMGIDRFVTVASNLSVEGVEAAVAARDDAGAARLRGIGTDGAVLTDETIAFGSGAGVAVGVLEGRGSDLGLDDAENLAREAVGTAADRDTDTGGDVDVLRLADDEA